MGKPKAIKAFTNLGFSFGSNPLKSKSILIFSLGLSATCSSSSPQEDYDGESGGERGVAGGPRSWSKLPTSRATSDMPNCSGLASVESLLLQPSWEHGELCRPESGRWGRAHLLIASSTSPPQSSHSRRAVWRNRTRRRWTTRLTLGARGATGTLASRGGEERDFHGDRYGKMGIHVDVVGG